MSHPEIDPAQITELEDRLARSLVEPASEEDMPFPKVEAYATLLLWTVGIDMGRQPPEESTTMRQAVAEVFVRNGVEEELADQYASTIATLRVVRRTHFSEVGPIVDRMGQQGYHPDRFLGEVRDYLEN